MNRRKETSHQYKNRLIQSILALIKRTNIEEIPSLGIDTLDITRQDLERYYDIEDLIKMEDELVAYEETMFNEEENEITEKEEYINPLIIVKKYKNGAIIDEEENDRKKRDEEKWRLFIPKDIKRKIPNWRKLTVNDFYDEVKILYNTSTGESKYKLLEYLSEISQLVFKEAAEDEDSDKDIVFTEGIAESIMSTVEMIILPHIEVLEKLKEKGGRIKFLDVWNQPFNESLKNEVKQRDKWRCVICESESTLHVHHKIPRNLGGVHHKDNLVTLCSSCHKVIETADIKVAFKKCLSNYKRNKLSKSIRKEELSFDIDILKMEVENKLDDILHTLNNKDEHKLVQEVIAVINRLEIIFND